MLIHIVGHNLQAYLLVQSYSTEDLKLLIDKDLRTNYAFRCNIRKQSQDLISRADRLHPIHLKNLELHEKYPCFQRYLVKITDFRLVEVALT
ncbi:hypothetical protein NIES4101_70400 [Calothrix sp. NIES-4101]|nr:hypothetical protein NIES4101_70400 [Calothrix sp. NIES-4101]